MNPRSLFRLPAVVAVAIVAVALAAVASAKKTSTRARAYSATTRDLNADGRIDAVDLRGSAPPSSAGAFHVAGHRVVAVRRVRGGARLVISQGSRPDTASRPSVSIGSTRVRAADGARPVLTSAPIAVHGRGGTLSAIDLVFSEPVIAKTGAVRVRGYQVVSMRTGTNGKLDVVLRPAGQDSRAGSPAVTLVGKDLRDASGNLGPSGPVKMSSGTTPGGAGGSPSGSGTTASTSQASPTGGGGSTDTGGGSTDTGTGSSGGTGGSTDGSGTAGSGAPGVTRLPRAS
jgi:hypothetical protein